MQTAEYQKRGPKVGTKESCCVESLLLLVEVDETSEEGFTALVERRVQLR